MAAEKKQEKLHGPNMEADILYIFMKVIKNFLTKWISTLFEPIRLDLVSKFTKLYPLEPAELPSHK